MFEGKKKRGIEGFIFSSKPPHFEELKNCRESFRGFVRVYMNSSNLIYVVIIFLKFKIY